jgi:hypothetical protein
VAVTRLRVHPELTAAANLVARDCLSELWRIRTTGNGSPVSYSVGWSTLAAASAAA